MISGWSTHVLRGEDHTSGGLGTVHPVPGLHPRRPQAALHQRARERAAPAQRDGGGRSGHPARLIEGQKTYGWAEALNELADAYPGRIQ
ncbi:hypothetical protein Acsp03_07480 [Actinomadura sp. NBRC 104412]|nr:hypothetical protein Acsp03_07480 [Actinomadura sp. NBRC 104412]